ncbi:MAG TPA: zinc ABC transporter substrate-binding protein [Solirubrobacterales bacterium]|nr:zinc ABC transporter substrate-binding protein [Solirubrobacterales bacterium]
MSAPRRIRTPRLHRLRGALLAATAVLAGSLIASGCGSDAASSPGAGGEIKVVATTNWHTDLAKLIGGDRVSVEGLMGPGVDPHLYVATAGDVKTLAGADVAIRNGLELEGKMDEVFEEIGRSTSVVSVGEAVPEERLIPIEGATGEFDPHIWFDPANWALAAEAVAKAFKEADPDHADEYEERLADFQAELDRTDEQIDEQIEAIPERSRVLVTSHDAFSYFAQAYGMEVEAIQGKSTASEATTADIERVADAIAAGNLAAVFIESSVPQQTIDAVLAAAEQRGQQVRIGGELYGDALGDPGSPDGTYTGAVQHNADAISKGLG